MVHKFFSNRKTDSAHAFDVIRNRVSINPKRLRDQMEQMKTRITNNMFFTDKYEDLLEIRFESVEDQVFISN